MKLTPVAADILARIVSRKREELRATTVSTAELRRCAELRIDPTDATLPPHCVPNARRLSPKSKRHRPAEAFSSKISAPPNSPRNTNAAAPQPSPSSPTATSSRAISKTFATPAPPAICPVIRKDFTISDYHVLEAAAAGADAILLIVAILDQAQLRAFREQAREFGMAALVEVHDDRELELALESGAEIIGVNNRDLRTFEVSLETSIRLAAAIPGHLIKVSESGIFNRNDIQRLMNAGYNAFLVGEHLVKSGDATRALQELVA